MLDEQKKVNFESLGVYCELITIDDNRYKSVFDTMFSDQNSKPIRKEFVLPIIQPNLKRISDITPLLSARIQESLKEYIDENPDITRSIMNANDKKIVNYDPVGKPHTEELSVGNVYVERDHIDGVCVITKFDFEDILSIVN